MYGNDKHNLDDSLSPIIKNTRVMQKLHTDNAPKMVGRKTPLFKRARKEWIDIKNIELNIKDEN